MPRKRQSGLYETCGGFDRIEMKESGRENAQRAVSSAIRSRSVYRNSLLKRLAAEREVLVHLQGPEVQSMQQDQLQDQVTSDKESVIGLLRPQ